MGGLGSHMESQIRENRTFEVTTDAPQQKRKKKKKSATIGND